MSVYLSFHIKQNVASARKKDVTIYVILNPLLTFAALKEVVMPKMKTHSSAKKRFTLTGTGKVKRFQANARHLMRKKSNKAKTRLLGSTLVSDADESRVKRLLCL